MRNYMIGILATTMLAGAATAQADDAIITNAPAGSGLNTSAPTVTETPAERAREYSTSDNEAIITEAQPGVNNGVPQGSAPTHPDNAGENAVIDEKPGIGMGNNDSAGVVLPGSNPAIASNSDTGGENAVIDERPGLDMQDRRMAPHGTAPDHPNTAGENAVVDEKPGVGANEARVVPGAQRPIKPHTAGENAVIDEKPGVGK